jgi:putative ABC transport system permease protein
MLDADRWHEVFETLRRNKVRTFLTALGVFWGVFMLVIMLGFGRGLEKGVMGNLGRWATNAVHLWGDETEMPYKGHKRDRRVRFLADDGHMLSQRIPGVLAVIPQAGRGWGGQSEVTRGEKSDMFAVSGEVPDFMRVESVYIDRGRFLNPNDLVDHRKIAVIGRRVREALFTPDENPIGQAIRVKGVPFTVVGEFHSEAPGEQADWAEGRVLVPLTTYARMNGTAGRVQRFTLLIDDEHSSKQIEETAKTILKRRHDIHPDDPGGVDSFNSEEAFRRLRNLFLGISSLSWIVGVLTLLAGAIGVSNILMISITERTREFGIRKAIGARPGTIMAQIIQEAVVLTGLSGALGLVAGVGVLAIANTVFQTMPQGKGPQFFAPPDLDLGKALLATGLLVVAGALAGIAPARNALAIRPVEALAHE